jgi:hypothetical protein
MPTPFESAQLNLKLFEMRRDPELRKARGWFVLEFHPQTSEEYFAAYSGDKNSWMRMVLGYWDMAASMVTHGAIDREMFMDAHGEIIGTFCKVQPYLGELRGRLGPKALKHIEDVVMAMPDAEGELARRRTRLKTNWDAKQVAKAGFLT